MQMFGTINLETAPVNPDLLYLVVEAGFCFPSHPLVESETCCLQLFSPSISPRCPFALESFCADVITFMAHLCSSHNTVKLRRIHVVICSWCGVTSPLHPLLRITLLEHCNRNDSQFVTILPVLMSYHIARYSTLTLARKMRQ